MVLDHLVKANKKLKKYIRMKNRRALGHCINTEHPNSGYRKWEYDSKGISNIFNRIIEENIPNTEEEILIHL